MEEFGIVDGVLRKYFEIEGKTSVIVPNDISMIGPAAFANCTNLVSITLLENVTQICNAAFWECTNLKNINILGNVLERVGYDIFENCINLVNINVSEDFFARLELDTQKFLILNFIKQYNLKNIYTENEINRYKKYILITKEFLLRMVQNLIEAAKELEYRKEKIIEEYILPIINEKTLLNFMCNNMGNVLTAKEVDNLIHISGKIGEVETTALLLEYKNNYIGYTNPLDEFSLDDKTK